ncbi:uncharacterized protein Z518_03534 [Rhinocladiella mackenziei CBS 650.93]|uniref:Rhinocladiella mackenziei CBS 650.93 unplaced genomic scaffold supercont1.2, whole genome shotgun sequence n=1 Tax=Rhinocladiella mackenziei CBS 650.93 TaxID=1442369 RepID=A0A0D2G2U9_9EURO|nr:uncharacterized protein Z518_03534 [Rhinocladiella mackenziei CBS 650.93]KIX08877.1 hypothetical protein Z518_03534 [Rhinocladiella mackenziei CBS 650.93]
MPLPLYTNNGPVDCSIKPETGTLRGKSVVITGGEQTLGDEDTTPFDSRYHIGANGFGEVYVREFSAAGAFVAFGDIDEKKGKSLAAELGSSVQFVKCDTTSWDDQLNMFKLAVARSPARSCDIVVANAGITGPDETSMLKDPNTEPTIPSLPIIQINMIGVLYTFKLGEHYLRARPEAADWDRCFIFKGSVAGLLDRLGYSASKFGLRGLIRSARRTSWQEGIRVNYVAPWYTKTTILKPQVIERLVSKGVEFAEVKDCATAVLRIACDKTIKGRSFAILPRSVAPYGYRDAEMDDLEDEPWSSLQKVTLVASIRTMAAATQNAQ